MFREWIVGSCLNLAPRDCATSPAQHDYATALYPQFAQSRSCPDQMCERFWTLPKLKKLRAEAMLDNAMLNDIAAR